MHLERHFCNNARLGSDRNATPPAQRALILAAVLVSLFGKSPTAQSQQPRPPQQPTAMRATIEGVVIYEADRKRRWRFRRNYVADRKNGHLAEALVCLELAALAARPDSVEWTLDQREYRFIPETLAIQAGDRVRFTNGDPQLHDVTSRQSAAGEHVSQTVDTFSLRQREEVVRTYRDAGGTRRPVALTCRFHGAMQGWIYVFDHPFFQVTGTEGKFRLVGVPPGKCRLVMVHAAGRLRWEQDVEVKAGEAKYIEIRVSPDHLETSEGGN